MDIVCSDFLWSLFLSALNHYKQDSLLRPFPNQYKTESGEKDFEQLKTLSSKIPQFDQLNWKDDDLKSSLSLLKWVINPKRFKITLGGSEVFSEIQNLVGTCEKYVAAPDFVFEVNYTEAEEAKFQKLCSSSGHFYAYHGSRVENFYSILQTGLRNNLNKVALYGEGIYLSSALSLSTAFSPAAQTWAQSLLGDSLSCVAVCEVIDHPDVKCSAAHTLKGATGSREPEATSDDSASARNRSRIRGSEGGEIPDKYYVVRNDDLVRVKFILVHAPKAKKDLIRRLLSAEVRGTRGETAPKSPLRQFAARHQFALLMAFYAAVLALIGVLNSRAFSNWWREVTLKNDDASFLR